MTLYAKNLTNVMKGITNTAENVVVACFYFTLNDVPIELAILSRFGCCTTAAVNVIDFQQRKLIAPTFSAPPPSEDIYCSFPNPPVLLTPLAPFLFYVVIIALSAALTVGKHVLPHILAVLQPTLFGSSITLVFLRHASSIARDRLTVSS